MKIALGTSCLVFLVVAFLYRKRFRSNGDDNASGEAGQEIGEHITGHDASPGDSSGGDFS